MPAVSRVGDKDENNDKLVEGSATVSAGDASGSPSFSDIQVTLPEEYDYEATKVQIQQTSRYAQFDEPIESTKVPNDYPSDTPPQDYDGEPKEESPEPDTPKETPDLGDCMTIETPINYSMKLTPNYTIGDLSKNALFPHTIRSQVGLSEQEIVCNLQALTENIIEPLRAEFGAFRINSGFRRGSGKSQHNKGMALDIQEPTWSASKHLEVAEWALANLPCDQIILEHGNSVWIHISFDRTKTTQRGQALTMINNNYTSGFKLYY